MGAFCRFAQPAKKAVPYYVVAGAALAAAWLCHEDNALLLPFVGCAAAVYLVFLFTSKTAGQKRAKLALLLLPLALWAGGITAWKATVTTGGSLSAIFPRGNLQTPWAP